MDEQLAHIQKELADIKERNRRVEADKAWEKSPTRIASISAITYVVAALVMRIIEVPNFYLAAFVPVAGFILSTRSLSMMKERWMKNR